MITFSTEHKSAGYLMKADFGFANDSRVTASDDLLVNKFDRSMKYDFAGGTRFNQFGWKPDRTTRKKRVYEKSMG